VLLHHLPFEWEYRFCNLSKEDKHFVNLNNIITKNKPMMMRTRDPKRLLFEFGEKLPICHHYHIKQGFKGKQTTNLGLAGTDVLDDVLSEALCRTTR
jgi:hypothetical protein